MNTLEFMLRDWREILALTGEHLLLVAVSTLVAIAIGIPVGLLLTRRAGLKRPVLAAANVLQTVPSLALFGLLITLSYVGIGWRAAVIALVVYALLPVIRNTVTGVEGVERGVREALMLGTRVALMSAGRVLVLDTPEGFLRSEEPYARAYRETLQLPDEVLSAVARDGRAGGGP